jgi:tetratricopeptide (TPR) repeat protein
MVSTPPGSELGTKGVERELAKLFGESLFGPWPELGQPPVTAPPPRRRLRWRRLLFTLVAALATALAIRTVIRPGLARRSSDEQARFARELTTFLKDGDLERVSRFITLVGGKGKLDPADPYLDLLVHAEAAAYRYRDADPERLRRIQPQLQAAFEPGATPDRLVAGLTVLSREERAARLPELERLRDKMAQRSDYYYLLATALEQRGDIAAARQAWQESARLGPAWLAHRFEQAEFERRQGNKEAAARIARRILEIDPQSAWSRLASNAFGVSTTGEVSGTEAGRGPLTPPAVQIFHARLLDGIAAARKGELANAQRCLTDAVQAVHGQAPFLLDAFDWLVAAQSEALARELTALPAWPLGSEVARAKMKRLTEAPPSVKARHSP